MTIQELNVKRDQILRSLGVTEQRDQDRLIRYPYGDDRLKELALIDAEIARLQSGTPSATGSSAFITFATFSKG